MSGVIWHIYYARPALIQQHSISVFSDSPNTGIDRLRVNPKLSFLKDDRFDPCRPYSKLGVDIDELWQSSVWIKLKDCIFIMFFQATDFTPLIKTLEKTAQLFCKNLAQLEWLNLGGGYLFNQIKDHRPFIDLVNQLKKRFDLEVYIEPGKAVVVAPDI